MSRVTLTPRAKADLDEIWNFTCIQWSMGQAEKYVRALWATMENQLGHLAGSIDIGDVRLGYRKAFASSHVIFFKVTPAGIEVVRILHKKMDFNRHLAS